MSKVDQVKKHNYVTDRWRRGFGFKEKIKEERERERIVIRVGEIQ